MIKASSIGRVVIVLSLAGLTACAGMDDTQQRMVSGGATGAVVGIVGTAITGGCIPCGTAIGGAVGTGVGYVVDQVNKSGKSGGSSQASGANPG